MSLPNRSTEERLVLDMIRRGVQPPSEVDDDVLQNLINWELIVRVRENTASDLKFELAERPYDYDLTSKAREFYAADDLA